MSRIPDRKYQVDCSDALDKFYLNYQRGLISIPTGGGKTIIFTKYARGKKTVVISHTDELVGQAVEKAGFVFGSSEECGFIQRDLWDYKKNFVSASIQTLNANIDTEKFEDFINGGIELIIIDEAHHTSASTYQVVLAAMLAANPNVKVLGVTATPFRMDEKDLTDFFEDLVYFIDIKELIRLGYLVPVHAKIISLDIDLDSVRTTKGEADSDFNLNKLSEVLNQSNVTELIVSKWMQLARDRKTIFFTSSVEHSKAICEELKRMKIKAVHVDGTMSLVKRKETVLAFKNGEIEVLCNMNIFTEGFDDPAVNCVALVRPTQSQNLYAQIIGRGLRPSPDTGKKDCLVLDYTGVSKDHQLANLFELFGVTVDDKHKEDTREFKIGSVVNEENEREIKLLFANETGDFDFFGNEAAEFITVIDANRKVLSCGKNNKFILLEKMEFSLWKLSVIQGGKSESVVVEMIDKLPTDYSLSFAIEKWNEHRDEFAKEFVRARMQDPTLIQLQYVNQLVAQNIISEELMRVATRFDASNLLSWGFYLSGLGKVSMTNPSYSVSETPYSCPKCGSAIVSSKKMFKCSTNVYKDGNITGCPFGLFRENKLLEINLSEEQFKTLLEGGSVSGENGNSMILDLNEKYFTKITYVQTSRLINSNDQPTIQLVAKDEYLELEELEESFCKNGKTLLKLYDGVIITKEQAEKILDGEKVSIYFEKFGGFNKKIFIDDNGKMQSSF